MAELPPLQSSTIDAIYAVYKADREAQKERYYLGISGFASDCDRRLWYLWRKASSGENFDGRMLRLFQTGHREEARMIADLRAAGVKIEEIDPETEKQFEVTAIGGHLSGHLDGKATGMIEAPKAVHVLEAKTHNAKSFAKLLKEGVERSKPGHYRQMMFYMHLSQLSRAVYIAHNKDTDELYIERIEYDPAKALRFMGRAERIVSAERPLPKLFDDPASKMAWECRYCPARPQCHDGEFARKHCRTCCHASPILEGEGARWRCERHDRELTIAEQMAGCSLHLFIPELVPGEQFDAAPDWTWIAYRMLDGSVWRDTIEADPEGAESTRLVASETCDPS